MTARQPAGTVTLVFTDIEGSTHLLEELGADAYRDALATHRDVVREACDRHDGYEVNYEGDAFFYAFQSARSAVSAVCDAMTGLEPGPIRIRVGIHTGEPGLDPPKYVGIDVHRAARLMGGAHGGQVVLSHETADLLQDGLFVLVDLGEHRFKDLGVPERVFQLGEGEHPPLQSLYRVNLPVPATPFLGRETELATVVALLTRPDTRLVTLTGPGGTGKTRLALQAAAEATDSFPDGVHWLALAPLTDATLVTAALARELGVKEDIDRLLADILCDALARKHTLLVLDNAEHLLPGIAHDIAFLCDIPGPTVLVTTRERLDLQAEHVYPVPPLSLSDAVALFNERARRLALDHDPDHPGIPVLCRRLDQLPLAIELAAARTTLFSIDQLVDRLGQHLDLLKGGRDVVPRQQTLRATIDWSYELLTPEEQQAFRALSVFAGGCTLQAAEAVCEADPDILQSLIDKSLLRRRTARHGTRYWLLQTIRDYGLEQLERSGATRDIVSAAARFLAGFLHELSEAAEGAESSAWSEQFADEQSNVQALVRYGIENGASEDALLLATKSANLWKAVGALREGYDLLRTTLDRAEVASTELRVEALNKTSTLANAMGDFGTARSLVESALGLLDQRDDPGMTLLLMGNIGAYAVEIGDYALADRHLTMALDLAREIGDEIESARASYNLGLLATKTNDPQRALPLVTTAYEIAERLGNATGRIVCLDLLGRIRFDLAEIPEACILLGESIGLVIQTGHGVLAASPLENLARIALETGEFDIGARLMVAALDLRERHDSRPNTEEQALTDAANAALAQASESAARILQDDSPLPLSQCIELWQQLVARVEADRLDAQTIAAGEPTSRLPQT